MESIRIDQTIMEDGKYRLNQDIVYFSPRYKKQVTVKAGIYDGATGATDLNSAAWYVHDQLCNTGQWDDGTPISNWQCSQVLQDILKAENRWFRARTWFWFTWAFGGGKARENGMITVKRAAAAAMVICALSISGCAYNSMTITADGGSTVNCTGAVDKPVQVNTTPTISGNTVPLSALP